MFARTSPPDGESLKVTASSVIPLKFQSFWRISHLVSVRFRRGSLWSSGTWTKIIQFLHLTTRPEEQAWVVLPQWPTGKKEEWKIRQSVVHSNSESLLDRQYEDIFYPCSRDNLSIDSVCFLEEIPLSIILCDLWLYPQRALALRP